MSSNPQPEPIILTPKQVQERLDFEREQTKGLVHMLQASVSERIAKSNYCVMNPKRTSIVKDPGLGDKPFFTPHKKRAEQVAKSVGGVVETLHDALRHLLAANNVSS